LLQNRKLGLAVAHTSNLKGITATWHLTSLTHWCRAVGTPRDLSPLSSTEICKSKR
jgi:hypothetical protein